MSALARIALIFAILTTTSVLVVAHGAYHECIQDQLPDLNVLVPQERGIEEMKRSVSQGGNQWTQPMRIIVDYSNLRDSRSCTQAGISVPLDPSGSYACEQSDVLDTVKENFLYEVINEAIGFYQNALFVYPIPTIKVLTGNQCGTGNLNIPASYANITTADFLLMVTARPTTSTTTIATAVTCQSDTVSNTNIVGRPTVGWANFGPRNIVPNNELERLKQIGVAIHETAHALGFSSNAFNRGYIQWVNSTSFVAIPSAQIISNVGSRSYLITPKVVAAARSHFACDTLLGGELETAGGAGTAGAHWSKKFYMNEYMTGTASDFPLYSQMTFSLFEDSGYYRVDWTRVSTLVWGRGLGCNFADDCVYWPDTNVKTGYKCSASGSPTDQCTFDLRGVGVCSEGVISSPLIGSCTYYVSRQEQRCDNPFEDPAVIVKLDAGEVHDVNSNVLRLSGQIAGPGAISDDYRCYGTACQGPTRLKLGIEGIWYDCPYTGGEVEPLYYGGKVKCRPYAADLICLDALDDETWPIIDSISPPIGAPGTVITINGIFLIAPKPNLWTCVDFGNISRYPSAILPTPHHRSRVAEPITVMIHGECKDVEVLSDTELICTVPDKTNFASLDILKDALSADGIAQTPLTVVVKDARGFTGMKTDGFTIEMQSTVAAANWIQQNVALFVCLVVGFVVIIVVVAVLIWKCCCKKSEQEKREARMKQHGRH